MTSLTSLSKRKQSIAKHFANANSYNQHATVQQQVCEILIGKIKNSEQSSVLEVGAGSGQLTKRLTQQIVSEQWHINELVENQRTHLEQVIANANIADAHYHLGDAEAQNLANNHSLIISANSIQWFDNPLNFIQQSAGRLTLGGQLIFNSFTPNNFYQIKQLTNQGLDYPTTKDWQDELVRQGLAINKLSVHQFELLFDSPYDVLQHIRKTGVSTANTQKNTPENFIWTKSTLEKFIKEYKQLFSNGEGKVTLTYEVMIIDAMKE